MDIKIILALSGWCIALIQFLATHLENRRKNEAELLEKTLSYFERGTQARSIAISLVEGIWLKNKKNLDVIVPVIISQIIFLMTEAGDCAQEKRNLLRLLHLAEKCIPYALDPFKESIELSEYLISSAYEPGQINLGKPSLRHWFSRFNNGSTEQFDIETEDS